MPLYIEALWKKQVTSWDVMRNYADLMPLYIEALQKYGWPDYLGVMMKNKKKVNSYVDS